MSSSMMNKLRTLLKQPYPLEQSTKQTILSVFVIGLFVSLFLVIFQPFHTADYIQEGRTWILWGYGVVTILALLFDILVLPRIFPRFFYETKWNIFRGICFQFWHIVSIGTANMLYAHFIGGRELSVLSFFGFLLTTLAVGFFPITVGVLSIYILLLKKYTESSRKINERLRSYENQEKKAAEHSHPIVISSESGREKLELNLKDLLFIKSIDNYVEVYWTFNDQRKTVLLRSTLKRIEEDLKAYPFLFRCHRTYLVNVDNISKVTGNSHGYKLGFKGLENLIPVSRNCSKKLTQLLT